jgi:predicted Holliday junction resolvase-like endonuclease
MKVRSGFVSNSSSSSFIVAVEGNTKVTLKVEVDLAELGKILKTEDDVRDAFNEYWGKEEMEEDEWVAEKYRKCVDAIKNGKIVIFGDVANDSDNPLEAYMYDAGIPYADGMEVIQDAG